MRLLRESQPSAVLAFAGAGPRLLRIAASVVILIMLGVVGYEWIEGWSFLDSLFMVVITLGAVGYNEVHPLSPAGKVFSMLLIVGGVGLVTYTVGTVTRMIIGGELQLLMPQPT